MEGCFNAHKTMLSKPTTSRSRAPMPIAGARLRVPHFLVLLIVSLAKFSRMVCNRQVVFSCIIEPLTNIGILGLRFGSMSYPYAYPFAYSCMFLILFLILVSVTEFCCKDRRFYAVHPQYILPRIKC